MGRVYNALLKSDRWKDNSRPIGRPTEISGNASSQALEPVAGQQNTGQYLVEQQPAQTGFNDQTEQGHQPPAFPFDLNTDPIAVDYTGANLAIGQFPQAQFPQAQFPQAVPAPVAAPAKPSFVEPKQIADASTLTIEPHMAALTGDDVLSSERYRTLAVRLLNLAARRKLKTIVVTSAREGEGKSTVATNLAWVMSKPSERRVLLIDADLRYPSVARLLGIRSGSGWLDMLAGTERFEDTAVRLDPNGLYVMTPNSVGDSSTKAKSDKSEVGLPGIADALSSSRVEEMLTELEQHFDFIIIDTPPILDFADAQRLASIVDGTVLVTRAGNTHHSNVTDALKLVPKERRVGVVLNEAQVEEEIAYHNRKTKGGFGRLFKRKK